MKINSTVEVLGTSHATAQVMRFDTDGAAHLMSILSNMYKDGPESVLREYACNALDSHVEAGNSSPILVTLPTEWAPNLIIQDFGTGLTKDEMINVYATYGKSTKRDTNDQIGSFGIGAKSAFTVSHQFVVTAIKNGSKTVCLFALNAEGSPTISVLSETPTTDSNGVTVNISVNNVNQFNDASEKLFSTWKPGTVLVNGVEPESIYANAHNITDNISVVTNNNYSGLSLVMGGIRYPASSTMISNAYRKAKNIDANTTKLFQNLGGYGRGLSIIAQVPTGSVDITPSREDLRDTTRTLEKLAEVIQEFSANIEKYLATKIDGEPDLNAAITKIRTFKVFKNYLDGFTYKGKHYDANFDVENWDSVIPGRGRAKADLFGSAHFRLWASDYHDNYDKHLAVVGVPKEKSSEQLRKESFKAFEGVDRYSSVVFPPDASGQEGWFVWGKGTGTDTLTYEEFIAKYKATRAKTSGVQYLYSEFATPNKQGYADSEHFNKAGNRVVVLRDGDYINAYLHLMDKDDLIIKLNGRQSFEPLKKRIPKAVSVHALAKENAKTILAGLTDQEKLGFTWLDVGVTDMLDKLLTISKGSDIFGAEVAKLFKAKTAYESLTDARRAAINMAYRSEGVYFNRNKVFDDTKIRIKYPLLLHVNRYSLDRTTIQHLLIYIEAINNQEAN